MSDAEIMYNVQLTMNNFSNRKFIFLSLSRYTGTIRNYFVRVIVLGLMILLPGTVMSQSLDSLVSEALQNNPRLKSLEYKTRSAEYRAESVNSLPSPTLTFEFSEIPFGKYNPWNDAISNSVAFSQMFMPGGKLSAMSDVERKNASVAGNNYESYKVNLIGQLKMSYYSLWLTERKIDIQKRTIELYNNLLNSVHVLYAVNKISQSDVITIRTEIASNETQLLSLQRQREAEVYKLNKLLGRDLSSQGVRTVKDPGYKTISISQNELEAELLKLNPVLKQMNNMIEMNKSMLISNQKDRLPDLMVQAMVMRQPQGMILTSKTDLSMLAMAEPKTEYMYSLMASITLPFAPWSSNKYSAREEEILSGIKGLEYERQDMLREMASGLRTAVTRLKASDDLIKLYTSNVMPLYEEAIRSQVSAYQNNQTNINNVIDSFRMHLMHEMNYNMAQADYQMAVAEIEMMTGKELRKGE